MVAMVGGSALGLSTASGLVLGSAGQLGTASQGRAGEGVTVNAVTGNLILQRQDEFLAGQGSDVGIVRTYNSLGLFNDDNGDNWRLGYSRKVYGLTGTVNTAGSTVKRLSEDGAEILYTYDSTRNAYVSYQGAGAFNTITYDAGNQRWVWVEGGTQTRELYDEANGGRIFQIIDVDGNILSLAYNSNGLISSISDANGEQMLIEYDATAGRTGNILGVHTQYKDDNNVTQTLTRVRYGYDSSNRLTSVTVDLTPFDNDISDGKVYVTTYTYDGSSKRVASIGQTDGSLLKFYYLQDGTDRIERIEDYRSPTDIRSTTFAYDTVNRRTTVTDALGQATVLSYDLQGQIESIQGPVVDGLSQSTHFAYDEWGNVSSVTDARGNAVTYGYDSNGNRILEQDSLGNTVARTYGANNQLLSETTYTGVAPGGGQPTGAQTTYFVYDANLHPRFKVSPEGRVTEYRYNAQGQRIAEIVYGGALNPQSAQPTLTALTTWAGNQTLDRNLRTDYQYDLRGLLSAITAYTAVDASGAGVSDGTQATTLFIYDQAGQLLQRIDPRDPTISTVYRYDGLGRVLVAGDALGRWTTYLYDDAGRQTTVTMDNGLATVTTYDEGGLATAVVRNDNDRLLSSRTYFYDELGRLIKETDEVGAVRYHLYDALGRRIGDIDPLGALTEYQYNANGQLIRQIRYVDPVGTALLAAAADDPESLTLAAARGGQGASAGRIDYRLYDAAGRLRKTIDAGGAVVEFEYDGAGQLTNQVGRATLLDSTQLAALALVTGELAYSDARTIVAANAATDRSVTFAYGSDGLLASVTDGEGFITLHSYNAQGLLTATTRRAGTSGASPQDLATYYFYDARRQLTGVVDSENYLTEYQYDQVGNKTAEIRYATRLSNFSYDPAKSVAQIRPTANPEDRRSDYLYDELSRLIARTDSTGRTVANYGFDEFDNPLIILEGGVPPEELFNDLTTTRMSRNRYDIQGRLIQQLSPEGGKALFELEMYGGSEDGGTLEEQIEALWKQYGTSYTYDAAGRLTSKTSPLDGSGRANATLYYYDKAGRLTHIVDAAGQVTETVYDVFGDMSAKRSYGTLLSNSIRAGLDLSQVIVADAALISTETFAYNKRGELVGHTSALGVDDYTIAYNAFGEKSTYTIAADTSHAARIENYGYDRRGLLTSDAVQGFFSQTTVYDAFGRAIQATDARGNIWSNAYDRLGRVVTTTDPLNQNISTSYDAFGRVLSQTDALGKVTTYNYDQESLTTTLSSPEGVSVITTQDALGQVVSVRDGRGNTTRYTYDLDGQLLTTVAPVGTGDATATTINTYDRTGLLIETTDALGIGTTYTYDPIGRLLTRTVDAGGLNLISRTIYNLRGESLLGVGADGLWTQDASGTWTQTRYDLNGQVSSVTVDPANIPDGRGGLSANPAGLNLQTRYTYDNRGNTLTVTEGAGSTNARVTRYEYDAQGRRIAEHIDPDGLDITTRYTYDGNDNPVSKTDANGNVTRYVYNARNERVYTVDPGGALVKTEYDAAGRLIKTTAFADRISLAGWVVPGVGATGELSIADVEARLSAANLTNVDNQVNYTVYDNDGRVRFVVDGVRAVTERQYDAAGNVIRVARYANVITLPSQMTVAGLAGAIAAANPDSGNNQTEYTVYDKANRAIFHTDAEGYLTQSVYDDNGRLTRQIQYTNKINGSLFSGIDTSAPTLYSGGALPSGAYITLSPTGDDRITRTFYDAAGRASFTVDGEGHVIGREFDAVGREVARTWYAAGYGAGSANPITDEDTLASVSARFENPFAPGLVGQRYTYDRAGRLQIESSVESTGTDTPKQLDATWHEYDELGRETETVNHFASPEQSVTHRVYDAAGRLTDEYYAYGTGAQTRTQYVLDKMGNRVQVIDPRGNSGYFYYDANNRVTLQVDPEGYVTETRYTAFGSVSEVIRYANKAQGTLSATQPPVIVTAAPNPVTGPYVLADAPGATAPRDQHTLIAHDQRNLQTRITDAEGYVETTAYDALGNKIAYTNKLLGIYTYLYDHNGRVIQETAPVTYTATGQANPAVVKQYEYDARGNLLKLIENAAATANARRTTNFQYDLENRQISKQGDDLSVGFDSAGGSTYVATALETRRYDARGNLIEVAVLKGRENGQDVTLRTLFYYDGLNRQTAQIDASGAMIAWVYDSRGKPVSELRYSVPVILPATAGGTPPGTPEDPDVRRTDFSYDGNNRLLTSTLRNVTVGEQLDPNSGYRTRVADIVTTYVYDANGNVVKTVDGRGGQAHGLEGNTTYSYYDRMNQLVMRVDELNYVTVWSYDGNGNVVAETRYAKALASSPTSTSTPPAPPASTPDDRITTYTYDRMSRMLSKNVLNVQYASSTASQLTVEALTDPNGRNPEFYGNTAYSYVAGNTFSTTVTTGNNSAGRNLEVGLDNQGSGTGYRRMAALFMNDQLFAQYNDAEGYQRIELTIPGGIKANTAYVVEVKVTLDGPVLTVYEKNSPQSRWTFPGELPNSNSGWDKIRVYGASYVGPDRGTPASRDGIGPLRIVNASNSTLMYEDFSAPMTSDYRGLDRTTGSSLLFINNESRAFSTARAQLIGTATTRYEYNGLGQITGQTQVIDTAGASPTTEVTETTYDVVGRKISEKRPGFVDYMGNVVRPETRYTYNGLDQLTVETAVHAATDTTASDQVRTYTYLHGVLVSQVDAIGAVINYEYDASGHITRKTLVGRTSANLTTNPAQNDVTLYQYDALGREIWRQLGGEVRGTRYNTFGEITGKRLGGTYNAATGAWSNNNWQETADYNVQGQVWRTNSGSGAYKVYVYDGNGNATLTIESAGADLASQTLNQILGLELGSTAAKPIAGDINLTVSVYDARNQVTDTFQPTMTANNRSDWNIQQILSQPLGGQYVGGNAQAQNSQATPSTALPTALSSSLAQQVGIVIDAHDRDTRGRAAYLYYVYSRTVTFNNLPNLTAAGFNVIHIVFTLDGVANHRATGFSGATVHLYAFGGGSSATVTIPEVGSDDERETPDPWANNRTGSFVMYAENSLTGASVQIGQSSLSLIPGEYTAYDKLDRIYKLRPTVNPTVGATSLNFNGLPYSSTPQNDKLVLQYRTKPSGEWKVMTIPPARTAGGLVVNGQYRLPDWHALGAAGAYDFRYTVIDGNGKTLTAQAGTMTLGAGAPILSTAQNYGPPGYAFLSGNTLNITQQGGNATKLNISYRLKGSSTWTTAQIDADTRYGVGGWFSVDLPGLASGSEYEYFVDALDGDNNDKLVNRARGSFVAGQPDSVGALTDQTVNFTGEPLGTTGNTHMALQYSVDGVNWITATQVAQDAGNHTIFHWDTSEVLASHAANAPFLYKYQILDNNGNVLNQAQGTLDLSGPVPQVTHANYGRAGTSVAFKPAQQNALAMKFYYGPKGSNPATFTPVILTRGPAGFIWDASSLIPADDAATEWDYYYDLYTDTAATTKAYDANGQPLHVEGSITLGGSAVFTNDFLMSGVGDLSTTIHRSQSYNAFGEIAEQTDGRINSGDIPAFMEGRKNTTLLYYNTLGQLVQQDSPYTRGIGMVAVDGTVSTAEPTRPRTFYAYDLAGRLIATQDANGNYNWLTLVAGFGNDDPSQALAEREFHADAPGEAAKIFGYDSFGNLRRITERLDGAHQRVTQQKFDGENRLIEVIRATRASGTPSAVNPTIDTYAYDQAGQRISHTVTAVVGNTSITTNGVLTLTAGTTTSYTERTFYDALGRVVKTTDYLGRSTTYNYTYDATILGAGGAVVGGYVKTTTLPVDGTLTGYTYTAPVSPMIDRIDYFGRTYQHTDFGGNTFTYVYNKAGWLTDQTSTGSASQGSGQQNIHYEYYANGYQKSIEDKVTGSLSNYEYDNEGNRTLERYTRTPPGTDGQGNPNSTDYLQSSTITYDELNRVIRINSGTLYDITYQYDANGNRLHMRADYQDPVNGSPAQDYWYKYDQMNRFIITMGGMVGNKVVAGAKGVEITYDWAGQRVGAKYLLGSNTVKETYTYTADGYLEDTWINETGGPGVGVLRARRTNDGLGRTTDYEEFNSSGVKQLTRRYTYNATSDVLRQQEWDGAYNVGNSRTTDYTYAASGVVIRADFHDTTPNSTNTSTDYSYVWWDEAKQKKVTITGSSPAVKGYWAPGYALFFYDVNGHILQLNDPASDNKARTVTYVTDAQGLVLTRNEISDGTADINGNVTGGGNEVHHTFYYLDGHTVGDVGNDGMRDMSYAEALAATANRSNDQKYKKNSTPISSADFDQNYRPVSADYPSMTPTSYTVRSGERLQDIAAAVWGDSSMWYLIADANGLSGSETLVAGQTLIIPNKLTNIHNNSGTYAVYDAAKVLGNVNPTLPEPPPPPPPKKKGGGCGGVGKILVVVVAVVVSVFTAGAALAAIAPGAFAAGTTLASAGVAALSGGLGTMMGAAGFGAAFAAGAIGAAVGSIVSQGLGIAMGVQDKFSWGQVATSAIGGGVTAGLNSSAFSGVFSPGAVGAIQRAAVGSVMSQGVGVATGMQEKFSWTQVAASAVGAGAGYTVGDWLSNSVNSGVGQFFSGLGSSMVNGGVQSAITGQRPDWGGIALQAFGQELGSRIGSSIVGEDGNRALQALMKGKETQAGSTQGAAASSASARGADSATPAQRQAAEQAAVSAGIANPQQATSSATLEEIVVTGNAWERVQHDYYNRMIQEGLSSGTAALFADNQWDAQRNREYRAGGGRQSFATGFVGAGRSQWNGAVDGQAQLYAGSHGWGAVAQGMFNPLVGTGELLGNTIGLINLAVDRDSAISKRVAGYWESQWDSVKAVGDLFYNAFTGNQEAAGQVTFLALEAGGAALITKRLGVPVRAEGGAALDVLSIQGGRGVVTNSGSNASRIVGDVLPEGLNPVPQVKLDLWTDYLTKRGVQFEVGTPKASSMLEKNDAYGLFKPEYNWETNTYTPTIYLPKNPNASVFYEEGLHALDYLKGTPRKMDFGGVKIDAWEYRAKSTLINSPNRLSYEEALRLERDLELVKQNRY